MECQRQEELKADNASLHRTPKLMTPWSMEKQCSVIYTHEVFSKFQEQIIAARDHCIIQGITECEDIKIVTISSLSGKERVVQLNKSDMFGRCSCKLYESYGIPCRHISFLFDCNFCQSDCQRMYLDGATMRNDGDSQQQQEIQQPWTGNHALSEAVAVDPAVAGLTGTSFEATAMDHLKPVVRMKFDTLTDV